jgi:FADH2 O2-dependent halogenase
LKQELEVDLECDVAILGSGFAGSVTSLILQRIGLRPLLIDKARHPRFAIGESSTPVANMLLRDLAVRYNLSRLLPLVKWGTWQKAYPHVGCGLKRGFSYFQHEAERPFQPREDHGNELLVAASADNEHSDTQWFRADVDQFLVNEARQAGIPVWERTTVENLEFRGDAWHFTAISAEETRRVTAKFLIDGTGEAAVLPKFLNIASQTHRLHTHSRTIFSHFRHVQDWSAMLDKMGGKTDDHPFCCDDAAQHQILDGAWVWVLRFSNGITSVGLVLDEEKFPLDSTRTPLDEWAEWLERYPSLGELLRHVRITDPPGKLLQTGRLQRYWARAAGDSWALLPHTAGFIDPLHSTGIAHSLCGIERLTGILQRHWGTPALSKELGEYERIILHEVAFIDRLVSGCFMSFGRFPLLVAYSMLYFAAATDYERRRSRDPQFQGAFLGADNPQFVSILEQAHCELQELTSQDPTEAQCDEFTDRLIEALRPFNRVGLGDRSLHNMYRYTAAPEL